MTLAVQRHVPSAENIYRTTNAPVTLYGWAVPAVPEDTGCRTEVNLGHPRIKPGGLQMIWDHCGHPGCAGTLEKTVLKCSKLLWPVPDPSGVFALG